MVPTITITVTDEARAFFERNPYPALRALVDAAVGEYGRFMGGLPVIVDALEDPETGGEEVCVFVEVDSAKGSMMGRHHEFMCGWRPRRTLDELRSVRFSYRYL